MGPEQAKHAQQVCTMECQCRAQSTSVLYSRLKVVGSLLVVTNISFEI